MGSEEQKMTFTSPSPHFGTHELSSKRTGMLPVQHWPAMGCLVGQLHIIRLQWGVPIHIVSGYRDYGNPTSQHREGRAADIRVEGVPYYEVAETIEEMIAAGVLMQGGLGIYDMEGDHWVHYDIRGTKARWRQASDGTMVPFYHGPEG